MQKKFEKLTTIAATILILVMIVNHISYSQYNEYLTKIEQTKLMLEGKMVKHCIYENGSATFEMSEEGFYGECGIVDFHYNPEKRCYEFTTYGENINGSQVAAEIQKLINNAPPNLSLVIQILLVVALIIQFLAILFGFKKLP